MAEIDKIEVKDLWYKYESEGNEVRNALNGLDITIKRGECVAVLGHNGSGKSTFAKHLNAILTPDQGNVVVWGMNTRNEELLFDIRRKVGMVFQNPDNQIVATVVEEDVAFAPENLGVPQAELRKRVDDAIKAVGMTKYKEHSTYQLSGGQKQRVAIAGIIAMQPDCIVLDEPTAMLDPVGRREIMSTIHKLNRDLGITIVLITHHMNEAAECGRVIVMSEGRVIMDDTPRKIFSRVDELKEAGLTVPQTVELVHRLKADGFDVSTDVLTVEDCVRAIGDAVNKYTDIFWKSTEEEQK